jgi:SurA-like N-terminal domain
VRSGRFIPFTFLLVVATVTTACGERFIAPAAVVDGTRISVDTLDQELDLVLLDPQLQQQVAGPRGEASRKDLTRSLLAFLIQLQVVQQYATANDISVSAADVDRALQQTIDGLGGRAQFQRELTARGLTVGAVRRNLERQVLFRKVEDSVAPQAGVPPSAPEAQKASAFQQWFGRRLRSADIDVNPRFGRLDLASGRIVAITSTAT